MTTPDGRVSPAMQYFNGSYAAEFNRRHDRTGHLFRERFRATTILTDRHLEHALAYVRDNRAKADLDPVRWTWLAVAGAVRTAA